MNNPSMPDLRAMNKLLEIKIRDCAKEFSAAMKKMVEMKLMAEHYWTEYNHNKQILVYSGSEELKPCSKTEENINWIRKKFSRFASPEFNMAEAKNMHKNKEENKPGCFCTNTENIIMEQDFALRMIKGNYIENAIEYATEDQKDSIQVSNNYERTVSKRVELKNKINEKLPTSRTMKKLVDKTRQQDKYEKNRNAVLEEPENGYILHDNIEKTTRVAAQALPKNYISMKPTLSEHFDRVSLRFPPQVTTITTNDLVKVYTAINDLFKYFKINMWADGAENLFEVGLKSTSNFKPISVFESHIETLRKGIMLKSHSSNILRPLQIDTQGLSEHDIRSYYKHKLIPVSFKAFVEPLLRKANLWSFCENSIFPEDEKNAKGEY